MKTCLLQDCEVDQVCIRFTRLGQCDEMTSIMPRLGNSECFNSSIHMIVNVLNSCHDATINYLLTDTSHGAPCCDTVINYYDLFKNKRYLFLLLPALGMGFWPKNGGPH